MFERSLTDRRRVIIVDFNHMAWSYAFSQAKPLYCMVKIDGEMVQVNTTIPAYTIKQINRWANKGINPTAICFDGVNSARCRKAYFAKKFGVGTDGKAQGYKARRDVRDQKFYDSINLTMNYLCRGGVSCYRCEGYEADDLIKACVDNAKLHYPNLPIDIITGDADLLPLVDEQVSVFMRSNKTTYAEEKEIEKKHYVQVTPRNFRDFVENMSSYRNLLVPYNTILLTKLLRGDKSDEIAGKPDWKPKMYNRFVEMMEDNGEFLEDIFRYDSPTEHYFYKGTTTPVPAELLSTVSRDEIQIEYGEPPALTRICEVIGKYCEQEDIDHVRFIYNGINLNGAFTDISPEFFRRPARLTTPIQGYQIFQLQKEISALQINIV